MIKPIYYFSFGSLLYTLSNLYLTYINIDFTMCNKYILTLYFFLYTVLSIKVSEIFLSHILIFFCNKPPNNLVNLQENPSIIINYNLKAFTNIDVELCFNNMFNTYINNIFNNSVAVLISVTNDDDLRNFEIYMLKEYRNKIYNQLYNEGEKYLKNPNKISYWNYIIFSKKDLENFCKKKESNFILIHRNTNCLKKCGQYQDLITLSEGYNKPYTYIDTSLYDYTCRKPNKYLKFLDIDDYNKIYNKHYKYTLVLDSDTIVPRDFIKNIIIVAESNPDYTIYQPNIKLTNANTIFQKLQQIWLENSNISYNAVSNYFLHSSFFGKGLINNKKYLEQCIGIPKKLIEYVPSNALSHDTFESMCMPVLFVSDYSLLEEPPKSYLSWNFRELRWNIGELIVFYHLFPRLFYKKIPFKRQKYSLSFKTIFFGLSAFRIMIAWPLLLTFILVNNYIPYYNYYFSYLFMICTTIIIPNLIIFIKTKKVSVVYLLTSLFHSLSEPLIGTTRLFISLHKIFIQNINWLPSNTIEQNISNKGNITSSIYYFGIYSVGGTILMLFFYNVNILLTIFLSSIIILPIYNFVTNIKIGKTKRKSKEFRISLKKIKVIKE